MGLRKRVLALALAAVTVLGLAACSQAEDKTNAAEVKAALEKLASAESLHSDFTMEIGMSAQGQSVQVNTEMQADTFNDPLKSKIQTKIDMGALGSQEISECLEQNGDKATMYSSTDGANWQKQEISMDEMGYAYNVKESMKIYTKNLDSFKKVGEDTVNGAACTRYDGVITGDDLSEALDISGAAASLQQIGISEQQAKQLYKEVGDLPISIWIETETGYPVKYEMDMEDFMQKLIDNIGASSVLTIDAMKLTIILSKFNAIENFEMPVA